MRKGLGVARRMVPVAVAILAGLTTACHRGAEPGTLVDFWAMGREGEVVQQLVPEFERRTPGVRVRVQQIPWSAAHEKLLTAYVGGAMPDVVQVGNTWLPELGALGALVPLDARVAATPGLAAGDEFPGIADANAIDGTRYGVPWYVDTRVLFYRSDLLRDAPPASWPAWRQALDVTAHRGGGEHYGILLPLTEWEPLVILGLQHGATLLRDGDRFGDFRSPTFRAAFAFYLDLFARGLAPRAGAAQSANLYQDFADGYFASFVSGPWNVGELARRLPRLEGAWATAPLPSFDGDGPGVSLAGGASLAIVGSSARADAAWQWIEFLAEPAQQLAFWRLTGDLPARPSAWKDGGLAAAPRTAAFWTQLAHVRPTPKIPEWERIAQKVAEHGEAAIRGRVDVDGALAALDRDVDAILEKRRWMLDRGRVASSR